MVAPLGLRTHGLNYEEIGYNFAEILSGWAECNAEVASYW